MRNILIVVDMQNDFIDGSLGTKEAQEIVTPVAGKIRNFEGDIYGTLDTHEEDYLSTQEGKNLLRGTVLIHDLRKHIIGDSKKKNHSRLVRQTVLMQAVLVDQAEFSFLEYDIFIQYPLMKFPIYNVRKLQIIMRVKLRIFSIRIRIMVTEILRGGHHCCIQITRRIKVPA